VRLSSINLTDVELMSSPISGGFLLDKNTGIPRHVPVVLDLI